MYMYTYCTKYSVHACNTSTIEVHVHVHVHFDLRKMLV